MINLEMIKSGAIIFLILFLIFIVIFGVIVFLFLLKIWKSLLKDL